MARVTMKDYVDAAVADLWREAGAGEARGSARFELVEAELDRRIENLRRESAANQATAATAVNKAEATVDRRLEAMNQFRAQLSDQAATFVTREIADSTFLRLSEAAAVAGTGFDSRLERLETWRATVAGRTAGIMIVWSVFIASASGLVVHLLAH